MSLSRTADVELLRRAGEGDAGAFAELDRRHRPLARHRAFRVLRSSAFADDAAQEALLDLWRTAGAFDERRSSVVGWICVLAHRRAVDLARREARRHLVDGTPELVPQGSYSAEELLLLRLDRIEVREALDRLPRASRELLELAYWAGLSQMQLARRFDLPLGTVKSRMYYGLRELRGALAA